MEIRLKVVLTYNYAEGKSDIEGKFSFNVQIDNARFIHQTRIFLSRCLISFLPVVPYKTAQYPCRILLNQVGCVRTVL